MESLTKFEKVWMKKTKTKQKTKKQKQNKKTKQKKKTFIYYINCPYPLNQAFCNLSYQGGG